mmetsp:Transcript_155/g.230  ORF Transcript_155/g.230 Transcript_155/m.230 type:complete len:140 (-) Transcript_155:86-505(-)|eukprot:CAMPEP_0202690334 /NCGR_PEP_ID=MMETSP1385-20130828/5345_1 /ASSEMBLY_ACC=CAM_ASM_000861 /TAXON_ID=933848 /ORGANISM="Elphidium margaritaceum" /LENGTH=139 /DNA_ID=CAMNT_0049345579 /DNA_START=42 /DNA_END=461 /DNA_ORIENTATION=+
MDTFARLPAIAFLCAVQLWTMPSDAVVETFSRPATLPPPPQWYLDLFPAKHPDQEGSLPDTLNLHQDEGLKIELAANTVSLIAVVMTVAFLVSLAVNMYLCGKLNAIKPSVAFSRLEKVQIDEDSNAEEEEAKLVAIEK